jgi:type IV secretion system protein TrbE
VKFRDLLHCVTYHDYPAALPDPGVRLNQALACEWQINGLYPIMNGWHLRPIVITSYPSEILPQTLSVLLQHPGHLTVSIRYRCLSPYDAQRRLEADKPFWRQTVLGSFVDLFKGFFGGEKGATEDAIEQIRDISSAVAASKMGASFGTVSCIAIVRDRSSEEADYRAHHLMGLLHGKGIMARIETIGAAKAIRTTWPGYLMMKTDEHEANRHKIKLTGQNLWDLAMPAKYWEGTPYVHSSMFSAQTPSPLVCSGTATEPFFFPVSVGGVNHILGIGKTGSGKSTFGATFVCAVQSILDSRVTWLDVGRSSYVISHLLDAEYHDVGAQGSTPLCPLALLDQPNGLQWLLGWFERVFFRRRGFELDERGSKDLMNALQDVRMRKNHGVTSEKCRNLVDLYAALPGGDEQRNRMRGILKEMIEGYGYIFAGEPSHAHSNRITVYELVNLDTAPKYISTPAKELILYNTIATLDGKPAWILWDEFWDAIGDDTSMGWFLRAIRTCRRLNCGFIGLTQSSIDITRSEYANLLLANMPGKLFFADDAASTPYVAESLYKLGLNPHEVSRIASARLGEFFYKSSIGARLASIWLGTVGQAICARTSYQDVEQARALFAQCPDGERLGAWLQAQGLSVSSKGQVADGRRAGSVAA